MICKADQTGVVIRDVTSSEIDSLESLLVIKSLFELTDSDCPVFFMLYKIHILPAHRLRAEDATLTVSVIVIALSNQ